MIKKTTTEVVERLESNEVVQTLADCNTQVKRLFEDKSNLASVTLSFAGGASKVYERL